MPRLLSLFACMAAVAPALLTDEEFDWIVGPLAGPPDTWPLAPDPKKNLTEDAVRVARLFAEQCKRSMFPGAPEARLHFDFDQTLSVRHVTMELLKLSKHGIDHAIALYEMDVRAMEVENFTKLDKPSRASSLWAFGTQVHVDNLIEQGIEIRKSCGPNSKIVVNTRGYIGPIMYLLAGATDSSGISLLDVFDLVGGKGSSTNQYLKKVASPNTWCEHRSHLPAQPDQPEEAKAYFDNLLADTTEFLPYETDSVQHCEACANVRYLMAAMAIDKSAGHVAEKAKMFDNGARAKSEEIIIDDSLAKGFLGQLKLDTSSNTENVGQYQLNLLRTYLVQNDAKPMPHWGISAGEASETAEGVTSTLRVFTKTIAKQLGEDNLRGIEPWFKHVKTPVQMPADLLEVHFRYNPVLENRAPPLPPRQPPARPARPLKPLPKIRRGLRHKPIHPGSARVAPRTDDA